MGRLNPRLQGDLGERSAVEWLWSIGAYVYIPFGHSPDVDLIADLDGRLLGIQVKTTTVFHGNRWQTTICTRGGNQSWNGLVKRFSSNRCDYLLVVAGDGRRWFIPSHAVEGGAGLTLGGPKYATFEVERGRPLTEEPAALSLS
jgi:PD-(D/E)XK endonuclease